MCFYWFYLYSLSCQVAAALLQVCDHSLLRRQRHGEAQVQLGAALRSAANVLRQLVHDPLAQHDLHVTMCACASECLERHDTDAAQQVLRILMDNQHEHCELLSC